MNRQQRRAAAARVRAEERRRRETICAASDFLAASDDPTVTGLTLILPSGEVLHLSTEAEAATLAGGKLH